MYRKRDAKRHSRLHDTCKRSAERSRKCNTFCSKQKEIESHDRVVLRGTVDGVPSRMNVYKRLEDFFQNGAYDASKRWLGSVSLYRCNSWSLGSYHSASSTGGIIKTQTGSESVWGDLLSQWSQIDNYKQRMSGSCCSLPVVDNVSSLRMTDFERPSLVETRKIQDKALVRQAVTKYTERWGQLGWVDI